MRLTIYKVQGTVLYSLFDQLCSSENLINMIMTEKHDNDIKTG